VTNFQAVYYRDSSGREPVAEFMDSIPPKGRAALKLQMGRLNLLSDEVPHLPYPHSSHIRGEIRELRCHWGSKHVRVLYARSDRLLVLVHAFHKASQRAPEVEIEAAEANWADFKERMNARPRHPPRAAGRDAP
jgi:phage-related protein